MPSSNYYNMNELRIDRNSLLSQTDFMMMPDYTLASGVRADLETYRQALRDLPSNTPDLNNVTWPIKPQIVTDFNIT